RRRREHAEILGREGAGDDDQDDRLHAFADPRAEAQPQRAPRCLGAEARLDSHGSLLASHGSSLAGRRNPFGDPLRTPLPVTVPPAAGHPCPPAHEPHPTPSMARRSPAAGTPEGTPFGRPCRSPSRQPAGIPALRLTSHTPRHPWLVARWPPE